MGSPNYTLRPGNGVTFTLPVIIGGEIYTFSAGNSYFKIEGLDPVLLLGFSGGPTRGRIVSPAQRDSILSLTGTIVYDETGMEVERIWISTRLAGTWQVC